MLVHLLFSFLHIVLAIPLHLNMDAATNAGNCVAEVGSKILGNLFTNNLMWAKIGTNLDELSRTFTDQCVYNPDGSTGTGIFGMRVSCHGPNQLSVSFYTPGSSASTTKCEEAQRQFTFIVDKATCYPADTSYEEGPAFVDTSGRRRQFAEEDEDVEDDFEAALRRLATPYAGAYAFYYAWLDWEGDICPETCACPFVADASGLAFGYGSIDVLGRCQCRLEKIGDGQECSSLTGGRPTGTYAGNTMWNSGPVTLVRDKCFNDPDNAGFYRSYSCQYDSSGNPTDFLIKQFQDDGCKYMLGYSPISLLNWGSFVCRSYQQVMIDTFTPLVPNPVNETACDSIFITMTNIQQNVESTCSDPDVAALLAGEESTPGSITNGNATASYCSCFRALDLTYFEANLNCQVGNLDLFYEYFKCFSGMHAAFFEKNKAVMGYFPERSVPAITNDACTTGDQSIDAWLGAFINANPEHGAVCGPMAFEIRTEYVTPGSANITNICPCMVKLPYDYSRSNLNCKIGNLFLFYEYMNCFQSNGGGAWDNDWEATNPYIDPARETNPPTPAPGRRRLQTTIIGNDTSELIGILLSGSCLGATSHPPTKMPSFHPTTFPTPDPSADPTPAPTPAPTEMPTPYPSKTPTVAPTLSPTTPYPTKSPTDPTWSPTQYPSPMPTIEEVTGMGRLLKDMDRKDELLILIGIVAVGSCLLCMMFKCCREKKQKRLAKIEDAAFNKVLISDSGSTTDMRKRGNGASDE